MLRLSDIAGNIKIALGILLIASFFLPWVAQTPSCLDRSVVIRDNISGYDLATDGSVPEVLLAPAFGIAAAALALIIRGRKKPLARSLLSLVEVPTAVFVMFYVNLAVRLFTPYIVRYGYIVTEGLFCSIAVLSLAEVFIHFPRLTRTGRIVVIAVAAVLAGLLAVDYLSRLFG